MGREGKEERLVGREGKEEGLVGREGKEEGLAGREGKGHAQHESRLNLEFLSFLTNQISTFSTTVKGTVSRDFGTYFRAMDV